MTNAKNLTIGLKSDLKYRSYCFSVKIIKFLVGFSDFGIQKIISNQLVRSATSVGANIFEAKSASSKRDFIKFYEIALKSANESKYWLALSRDSLKVVDKNEIKFFLDELNEISNMLAASLLTLKNKKL